MINSDVILKFADMYTYVIIFWIVTNASCCINNKWIYIKKKKFCYDVELEMICRL